MSKVCPPRSIRESCLKHILQGLNKRKDNLHDQLAKLQSKKSKEKTDEALILEIERLKSSLKNIRDDLVCSWTHAIPCGSKPPLERYPVP